MAISDTEPGLSAAVMALAAPVPQLPGANADLIYGALTWRSVVLEVVASRSSLAPAYAASALAAMDLQPLLLQVDGLDDEAIDALVPELIGEARLLRFAPILLFPPGRQPSLGFWDLVGVQEWPVVVVVEQRDRSVTPGPPFATVRLTRDQPFAQARAWRELLPADCADLDLSVLGRIRLGLPSMREAFERAASTAAAEQREVSEDDLVRYSTEVLLESGSTMARVRVPTGDLSGLVVAGPVRDGIADFATAARRLLARDPVDRIGLRALFTGPSGTGKTATAEALGSELGVPVLFVDVSQVVDKYIGETEKHLDLVLGEAENTDALLVFDEGESLFSARTHRADGVGADAGNRQTAYLLARLEQHRGLVIVASNYAGSIDKAFVRRFHFTITFATPNAVEREEIWRTKLGKYELAVDDVPGMWTNTELAGGNIENVCLLASLLRRADQDLSDTISRLVQLEATRLGRRVAS